MSKYNIVLIFLLFTINAGLSQETQLGILAKVENNQTKLKIFPKTAYHWLQGIDNGYIVSRREVGLSDFLPIHQGVIKPAEKDLWLQAEKGQEMYDFQQTSISKIRGMLDNEGSFLASFQRLQRADENFKLYIMMTMRDKVFGDYTGLELIDESAILGKLYEYKVTIKNSVHVSEPVIFDGDKELQSPSLTAKSKESSVGLSWVHDENSSIFAYFIERSETGLKYERLMEAPIWPTNNHLEDTIEVNKIFEITHADSLANNYEPHHYRLVALDVWGDEWEASAPVIEMGRDMTGPAIGNVRVEIDSVDRHFVLSWDPSPDSDLQSYFISKTHKVKGLDSIIVQGITPQELNTYIYKNPIEMKNYYFKIGAIDTSGNYSISQSVGVFINDITAPTLAKKIEYEVDSLGTVTLSWGEISDHNPNGYWVFKSFDDDTNFMKITDTLRYENQLVDSNSISLLHHEVYYYVTALDKSFNVSEPTDILKVVLPDTIPPSTSYLSKVIRKDNMIILQWDANQSEDIVSYELYKKLPNQEWSLIGTVPSSSSLSFTYEEIWDGIISYKVIARDERDNVSKLGPSYRFIPDLQEEVSMSLLLSKSDDAINLSWSDIGIRYKIYRKIDGKFQLYDYLDTNSIIVSKNPIDEPTSFYIKAYDDKGRLMATSNIREI